MQHIEIDIDGFICRAEIILLLVLCRLRSVRLRIAGRRTCIVDSMMPLDRCERQRAGDSNGRARSRRCCPFGRQPWAPPGSRPVQGPAATWLLPKPLCAAASVENLRLELRCVLSAY